MVAHKGQGFSTDGQSPELVISYPRSRKSLREIGGRIVRVAYESRRLLVFSTPHLPSRGLARPAPLLRRQLPVHELREDEHGLGQVRGVLQRPLGGARHAGAVVGLGEAHRRFGVVPLEYGGEFGERLLLALRDDVSCGHGRAPFVSYLRCPLPGSGGSCSAPP